MNCILLSPRRSRPLLRIWGSCDLFNAIQQSNQAQGVVHGQGENGQQPYCSEPGELCAVAECWEEELHVVLSKAVEDGGKAGDVEDTPDNSPDSNTPLPTVQPRGAVF